MRRRARRVLIALVGALLAGALALFLSGLFGWPSRTIEREIVVQAPRAAVWAALTDFERYDEWNPLYTRADGEAREGAGLDLRAEVPGENPTTLEGELVILHDKRKLRWQHRTLLPGLGDQEYEVILEPLPDGSVRVVQRQRFEGLLSSFAQIGAQEDGLEHLAQALQAHVESEEPGTVIAVDTLWNCTQPLENYGDLPITIKSRIDNDRVQPEKVEAVWLTGPNCAGDGDPTTIDLILQIEGDGSSVGPSDDAVKLRAGPHDIDITGYGNCGAKAPGSHQDGVHAMLGYRIRFVDFEVGNVEERIPTCDGLGFFVEERSEEDPEPEDVVCLRCTIVVRNRGLLIGDSIRSGAVGSLFVANLKPAVQPTAVEPVNERNRWKPLGEPERSR